MNDAPDTRASLIIRLRQPQDAAAWGEFVELYEPVIYRTARRWGLQHDDAAEVSQEVLTRVARAVDRWQPGRRHGSFRGWLYRITRNMVIQQHRGNQRRPLTSGAVAPSLLEQHPDPRSQAATEFDCELERECFLRAAKTIEGQFASRTWQAFWQTAVQHRPVEQVGRELNMSRGAIYIARCRVLARLRDAVQRQLHENTKA